ncbi:SMC-Scp complex subunit ScpB [Alkalibaculum sp. M08DMB]|uniref:Segregation and condensation protein B n=1 Tax=Alkalibaculum sporogenes TaxID=2655001 RepID=A0A6A7K6S3_9FIRM|nr:SMC-Scp complex subunit ScpB [Alkalibaculum sporogenes]MPW25199.1 SMC-Scp complex subunit ScpB [Alkalibaculum sporogenes]
MDVVNLKAAIEAILFALGEAISLQEIAQALDTSTEETKKLMDELVDGYNSGEKGIQIIQINTKYQFCTRPKYHEYINSLMNERSTSGLSQAALETLSIIAYKQPVTRVEVENLRGVKSSSSLQTLIDRNLIKEAGRLDAPGKPFLYETTFEFLKYAGITNLDDLPEYEVFVASVHSQEHEEVAIQID